MDMFDNQENLENTVNAAETVESAEAVESAAMEETAPEEKAETAANQQPVRPNYEAYLRSLEEEKDNKKKADGLKSALIVLVCLALVIGIIAGIYFLAASIVKDARGHREPISTELQDDPAESKSSSDKTDPAEGKDSAEKKPSPKEDSKLTHSDDVEKTDLSGTTYITDVSEIVDNVMPSIVAIVNKLEYTAYSTYNPYDYFFGGGFGDLFPGGRGQDEDGEMSSAGSGVIVGTNDEELLIVTNAHVVSSTISNLSSDSYKVKSTTLTVTFGDESTADAYIKGTDSNEDLAVIGISLSSLSKETREYIKIAVIGDSEAIRIGAGVIAIGNALGYGQSVTAGIISAKNRSVTINGITRYLLQTDAAINPGNSGGGLFNAKGELVGINSAKTTGEEVEGMGFAIPISKEQALIEELMNREAIPESEKGYLGITGQTVPDSYIVNYGYPQGASIQSIYEGSTADKAGLQIYDIVTAINGVPVSSMEEMKERVNSYKAGTTITVTVARPSGRQFKELNFKVKLMTLAEVEKLAEKEQK